MLQDTDGQELAQAEMTWGPLAVLDGLHTDAWQPVVIPLRTVLLPGPGDYSIEVLIDGIHQVSIDFVALLPPDTPDL
jgi:hypothetical protein